MRTKIKISGYILRSSATALLLSCVVVALSSAISLPNHPRQAPTRPNNTAFGLNGHEGAASVAGSAIPKNRTLAFADRVAYQRAIEEVYWRHRIWPKENTGPKPPLDELMSHVEIENKVKDYLRKSQALEDYWQKPITPDQLQNEIDRMAAHTKQPEVLREIFAALGNDPFVIADCLARPVLAERLLAQLYAHDQRFHGDLKRRAEAELQTHPGVKQMKQTSGMYTEMEWIKSDSTSAQDKGGSASPEEYGKRARQRHGIEDCIRLNSREWDESVAKLAEQFDESRQHDGAAFTAFQLAKVSPLQEDDGHYYALAVMKKGKDRLKLATVAWAKEPLRSWLAKAETQAPATMAAVTANFTLPGIASPSDNFSPSAGCTDDTWTAMAIPTPSPTPAARYWHTAVWTGTEMIVWGGYNNIAGALNTGWRYNPSADSWTATSTTNTPVGRYFHTAVWTGSEMIVWGGANSNVYNTGGRYNPSTDSWIATSNNGGSLKERSWHAAVWTGSEMIVWGGVDDNGNTLDTGDRYNPGSGTWTALSTTNAPTARWVHTAIWTGTEMIVWGGIDSTNSYLNSGGRYTPGADVWTPTSTTNAPAARSDHRTVWTGTEMIVWGGVGGAYLNTGGRYNPGTDSWTSTSTTNAPAGRQYHTAVWAGITSAGGTNEMIVWGGFNGAYFNTGGRYNPSTDSWTATSITNAPTARSRHVAVWTGTQMIVWGGVGNGVLFDTGGRYCAFTASPSPSPTPTPSLSPTPSTTPSPPPTPTPSPSPSQTPSPSATPTPSPSSTATVTPSPCDDTWTGTSTTNAPDARADHSAVWTGSEMIVWGGGDIVTKLNSGGRYTPSIDSWTPTTTSNAPAARSGHKAVWTGTEMIVWGGYDGSRYLNTGGRYDPSTDSWVATNTTNVPAVRVSHTAVWTGSEMIVWGGSPGGLNTGGRYNPNTNSWTVTSTVNAPAARYLHTAIWTGSEMIVWGGYDGTTYFNTGARYDPTHNRWTATSTTNAPDRRGYHTAVWTGSEMIVWSGYDGTYLTTGGRYNPSTNSWIATSTTTAPVGRQYHTAVWTSNEMIVWSGYNYPAGDVNTGGRYNPTTDSWTGASLANAPDPREQHTAVWTGSQMIVWGGFVGGSRVNTGGRYCAATPSAPAATSATNITATSFSANWKSVTGATGYRLDVSTTSSFVTYVPGYQNVDVGNVTSRNVTGLSANTTYYYRLRAYIGNATSPNSNVIRAKTKAH